MKLKQLKSMLDDVETFDKPNVQLEQYPTPPDIAGQYYKAYNLIVKMLTNTQLYEWIL